jgi:hypothetical protein
VLDQIVEIEFVNRIVAERQRSGDIAQNGRTLAREAINADVSLEALVATAKVDPELIFRCGGHSS